MLVWESARVRRVELSTSDRDWLITDPRCLAPGLLAPLYLPSQLQAGTSGFRPWLAPKKGVAREHFKFKVPAPSAAQPECRWLLRTRAGHRHGASESAFEIIIAKCNHKSRL